MQQLCTVKRKAILCSYEWKTVGPRNKSDKITSNSGISQATMWLVKFAVKEVKHSETLIRSLKSTRSIFSVVCFLFSVISLTHTLFHNLTHTRVLSFNASANCFCLWKDHTVCSQCIHYSSRVGLNILNTSREPRKSLNLTVGLRCYICHDVGSEDYLSNASDIHRLTCVGCRTERSTHRDNMSLVCDFCFTSVTINQKWTFLFSDSKLLRFLFLTLHCLFSHSFFFFHCFHNEKHSTFNRC